MGAAFVPSLTTDLADVAPAAPTAGQVFVAAGSPLRWTPTAQAALAAGSATTAGAVTATDGVNIGRVRFNAGQLEVTNNGLGFSIGPDGKVGVNVAATQQFTVMGSIGLSGFDWTITNNANTNWGFRSTSAGGAICLDVVHQAGAQPDPSLHGFRVVDLYTGIIGLHIDGNALAKYAGPLRLAHVAAAAAPNDSLYFSTTAGKPVYKDSSGVENPLY